MWLGMDKDMKNIYKLQSKLKKKMMKNNKKNEIL